MVAAALESRPIDVDQSAPQSTQPTEARKLTKAQAARSTTHRHTNVPPKPSTRHSSRVLEKQQAISSSPDVAGTSRVTRSKTKAVKPAVARKERKAVIKVKKVASSVKQTVRAVKKGVATRKQAATKDKKDADVVSKSPHKRKKSVSFDDEDEDFSVSKEEQQEEYDSQGSNEETDFNQVSYRTH